MKPGSKREEINGRLRLLPRKSRPNRPAESHMSLHSTSVKAYVRGLHAKRAAEDMQEFKFQIEWPDDVSSCW